MPAKDLLNASALVAARADDRASALPPRLLLGALAFAFAFDRSSTLLYHEFYFKFRRLLLLLHTVEPL